MLICGVSLRDCACDFLDPSHCSFKLFAISFVVNEPGCGHSLIYHVVAAQKVLELLLLLWSKPVVLCLELIKLQGEYFFHEVDWICDFSARCICSSLVLVDQLHLTHLVAVCSLHTKILIIEHALYLILL